MCGNKVEPQGHEAELPRRSVIRAWTTSTPRPWRPHASETAAADAISYGQWNAPLFEAVLREAWR